MRAEDELCRRAKDYDGLRRAVGVLFEKRRNFVLWWDGQEKARGLRMNGRHEDGSFRASEIHDGRTIADFGLDRDTIHRWRRRLKDPRKFDAVPEKAQERCVEVCEARL